MKTGSLILCACGVLLAGALAGCSSGPRAVDYARAYPALKQGETLDIQVFRRAKRIELTNTTARAFGPSTLWLNAWYSRPLGGLGVGQTLDLPLKEFRDENSEPFRGGGFFAAEAPDRLVLAQLETTGPDGKPLMLGLVVVSGGDEP